MKRRAAEETAVVRSLTKCARVRGVHASNRVMEPRMKGRKGPFLYLSCCPFSVKDTCSTLESISVRRRRRRRSYGPSSFTTTTTISSFSRCRYDSIAHKQLLNRLYCHKVTPADMSLTASYKWINSPRPSHTENIC